MAKYGVSLLTLFLIILIVLLFNPKSTHKIILDQNIQYNFLNSQNKSALYYFGYVGCSSVCPERLTELNKVYTQLDENIIQYLDVIFVNMKDTQDKLSVDLMAKYFNQNFKGINISIDELRKIQRDFHLYVADGLLEPNELNHSSFVYLVCKEKSGYNLLSMFMKLNKEEIQNDIKRCMENGMDKSSI